MGLLMLGTYLPYQALGIPQAVFATLCTTTTTLGFFLVQEAAYAGSC